jgi:colanic acid/amylovoran biosynthesis protein
MMIEIRKAGFVNKGAHLMLLSALAQLRARLPGEDLVMAPDLRTAPYRKRAGLGLYQKVWFQRYRVQWGFLGGLIPRPVREYFGLVLDREIDAVLDASGFSYSDQVGLSSVLATARACERWKKRGTKVILLPQAFGPFEDSAVRTSMKRILDNSDLVFARDDISYKHLADIAGTADHLRKAPDFTCLLEGQAPGWFDPRTHRFCLIPNHRMLHKTSSEEAAAYERFLWRCCRILVERGERPFFLIHEGKKDIGVADRVNSSLDSAVPVVSEDDPVALKGIIGECRGVIGSRYHGLVSALSQGVPSLAAGWSHKYEMLFGDYGFPEGIIDVTSGDAELEGAIGRLVDTGERERVSAGLLEAARSQKELTTGMWDSVFELLGS